MRKFAELLHRFRQDEGGAFLVIFGVLAIVLIAAAGAVVDYTSVEQARTRAQLALDSAALGLQPTIFSTPAPTVQSLKDKAQLLLRQSLNDSRITATVDNAAYNTTDGTLKLDASIVVPMNFVQLVGITTLRAKVVAEATRKRLNLEVVMVLDNSNSMDQQSRMTNLIAAAKCATNIMMNNSCSSTATTASNERVAIGIVPFTLAVNVGPGNANAAWLDRSGTGVNSITRNNFDNDDNEQTGFAGPVDRIALFSQMRNISWGGCVEARLHDASSSPPRLYDTDDTVPNASVPGTLFTPYFAPDEPDANRYDGAQSFNNSYLPDLPTSCPLVPKYIWTQVRTRCNGTGNTASRYNNLTCSGGTTTNSYQQISKSNVTTTVTATRPNSIDNYPSPGDDNYSDSYSYTTSGSGTYKYTVTRVRTWTYITDRMRQERLCKYIGATPSGVSQGSVIGPNGDCPVNAIQPLTATKSQVMTAINALEPQGGTNIHAGVEWGFRVLSPTEPFTQGEEYSTNTAKVMIVMTDGENTAYPSNNMNNAQFYGNYGFPYNSTATVAGKTLRLGDMSSSKAQLESEMNRRTELTCANAKAKGISIYTIGLSVNQTSNPTANTNMLKNCSSGDGYWYFPTQSSELVSVFTSIATQLSKLRLAK